MKYDVDQALQLFALAARKAEQYAAMQTLTEDHHLMLLPVLVGEAINAHNIGDADAFRGRMLGIAALCAYMEQWTEPKTETGEREDCPDCAAQAAAEDRAKRETEEQQQKRDAEDLTLRDFWWTIHGDSNSPFGAMLVTRQRSSYPHVNVNKWNLVRARDYGHAVVKAAEAANQGRN